MQSMASELWYDESGFVVGSEMVLLTTICVIGILAGLSAARDSIVGELADVGAAVGDVNQSYSFGAVTTSAGVVNGSSFTDVFDFCELPGNNDRFCSAPACISICGTPTPE